MAAALKRQRIPGDRAAAAGQEQGGDDLAWMAEDESGRPLGDPGLALRLRGTPLRRPCRRFAPHHGGQVEVIIGLVGKSVTQGDRSVFVG
jgi:hypothetical protein